VGKHITTSGSIPDDRKLLIQAGQSWITLRSGWPRAFMDYETGDPYIVKQFSEKFRLLMETGLGEGKNAIFPQDGRMNKDLRNAINQSIFSNDEVRLDSKSIPESYQQYPIYARLYCTGNTLKTGQNHPIELSADQ
jgi:hypothetical protein